MRSSTALMAAVSLLLLLVSLAAAADIQIRDKSEEETRRIFEERRYAIFKDNLLRSIDQQSAAGIRWQLNNSSDHTHGEELRAFRPCYIPLDVYGDWSKTKGAWIAYMLFVCSFIVVLAFCKLHA
ncbi:hypothetical protein VPH35_133035 [Triticum aestivum]